MEVNIVNIVYVYDAHPRNMRHLHDLNLVSSYTDDPTIEN